MKKKIVIGLSVILGLVAVILTLCFAVFTVKSVEIDFRTSTTITWDEKEIVESSNIQKGKCLLFLSKKGFIENIEKANPYLEVINIETVFPSALVIHCAERRELFAIQQEERIIYCDKDLKVLKIDNGVYESTKDNAIMLSGVNIHGDVNLGGFLDIEEAGIKRFLASMVENSKSFPQTLGFCKAIKLEQKDNVLINKKETNLVITTFSGRELTLLNIESNLSLKLQRMFQALSGIYELLVTNGDYTNEEVDRCSLVIGNQITDENELYVHIYLDGEVITSPFKE